MTMDDWGTTLGDILDAAEKGVKIYHDIRRGGEDKTDRGAGAGNAAAQPALQQGSADTSTVWLIGGALLLLLLIRR
jgi:hypothetical protein